MADYADWTDSMELLGTEIQVPIDIQGAFIQLPVDIQGQLVTLEVDIVAQTVGSIAMDIAAQTVGDITMNINAQSVAVKSQGEWSLQQGDYKVINLSAGPFTWGQTASVNYTVPEGKNLYITTIIGFLYAVNAADAEKPHPVWVLAYIPATSAYIVRAGNDIGLTLPLSVPIRVNGGVTLSFVMGNLSNHSCWGYAYLLGYEV